MNINKEQLNKKKMQELFGANCNKLSFFNFDSLTYGNRALCETLITKCR